MKQEKNKPISSATIVGFLSTSLFISLTMLKLIGMLHCSWWWVTAPIWIPLCVYLLGNVIFIVAILWVEYACKFDEDDNYIENCDEDTDKSTENVV